jgi:divalent metal cation (Fe/Co/Zn/Cd) transporter
MPDPNLLDQIRQVALNVPGAAGVEKLFARDTGLQYHVELHLEMTVRQAHEIANDVRFAIRRQLSWVADVLVHVEPSPSLPASQTKR